MINRVRLWKIVVLIGFMYGYRCVHVMVVLLKNPVCCRSHIYVRANGGWPTHGGSKGSGFTVFDVLLMLNACFYCIFILIGIQ